MYKIHVYKYRWCDCSPGCSCLFDPYFSSYFCRSNFSKPLLALAPSLHFFMCTSITIVLHCVLAHEIPHVMMRISAIRCASIRCRCISKLQFDPIGPIRLSGAARAIENPNVKTRRAFNSVLIRTYVLEIRLCNHVDVLLFIPLCTYVTARAYIILYDALIITEWPMTRWESLSRGIHDRKHR